MAYLPFICPSCFSLGTADDKEEAAICAKCGEPFVTEQGIALFVEKYAPLWNSKEMPEVFPAKCPACGAYAEVSADKAAAICASCGKPYVVKKAISLFCAEYGYLFSAHEDTQNAQESTANEEPQSQLHLSETLVCSSCGSKLFDGDLFCYKCGTPVIIPEESQEDVCPKCGTKLFPSDIFCFHCGAILNDALSEVVPENPISCFPDEKEKENETVMDAGIPSENDVSKEVSAELEPMPLQETTTETTLHEATSIAQKEQEAAQDGDVSCATPSERIVVKKEQEVAQDSDVSCAAQSESVVEESPESSESSQRTEPRKKRRVAWWIGIAAALCLFALAAWQYFGVYIPKTDFNKALSLMENGDFDEAIVLFEKHTGPNGLKTEEWRYQYAIALMNCGRYNEAREVFDTLGDFRDSTGVSTVCANTEEALNYLQSGNYYRAAEAAARGARDDDLLGAISNLAEEKVSAQDYVGSLMVLSPFADVYPDVISWGDEVVRVALEEGQYSFVPSLVSRFPNMKISEERVAEAVDLAIISADVQCVFDVLCLFPNLRTQERNTCFVSLALEEGKFDFVLSLAEKGAVIPEEALAEVLREKQRFCEKQQILFLNTQPYPGQRIQFGFYEQDNVTSNGKEPIEWYVVERENGKILCVSDKILDVQPFNSSLRKVTWETCSLRKWLNDYFFNEAFSEELQKYICTSQVLVSVPVQVSEDAFSWREPTVWVDDKVFLLDSPSPNCNWPSATQYALDRGGEHDTRWIRTPWGQDSSTKFLVYDGWHYTHAEVTMGTIGVQPAIWLDVEMYCTSN